MIPILYEGTETEFTSQGLGSLSDATSCTISEEINNTYELEMNYPMTGVHFFDIKVGRIILATPAPRKESEPFSIYKISKPIDGIVTIYAEHISYRLSYIPVKPFSASNCYEALNGCVENSLEDNPFTVWTDKALNINFSFTKPQSFRLCLGGVEGSILDTYRGEYEFNRFTVKLHTNRGSLKDTAKIIYGKNLTDLKQEESIENTITGIVPYWSSTVTQTNDEGTSTSESVEVVVTLPEYALESEYADKFPYKRTAVVDLSEYFKEQPTVDELRTRANQYMKDNLTGLPAVSLTVSFIDLARSEENKDFASEIVYLGDQVPVYFENLGIAAKAEITSAIYDVLADRYDSLTLGTVSSSLSKTLNEISKKQDTAVTQTNLQSALILAQKVMAGGAGGYIVTKYFNGHPSETYYGDTDNVDTMVNVIRINKNGIAFSNSGISGPYVSAWTIDGKFNADFIQAGKISGSFIEANSITVGKLSDEVQADISNAKDGAEKANNSIIDLQKQIDGVIESWSADPVPTLTNYPASSWTTNKDKEKHIGDLYYDKSNKCYRFMQNSDGSFSWKLIADTDVTKAIADAQKALDATDQSVTGVTTEYYASTSATELKGGSWSEDRPAWTESNYIWSRTKTTTKAGITTYSSPSCIQGNSGTDGKDGISPTVAISKTDGSTTITITDKNGTHSQVVKDGVNGTPGATGADGKTSYFHVKYSNDGGKTFTPNNGEEVGTYIGTYSDFKIEDSTSVSAYTWAKIKGEQGERGLQGIQGKQGEQGIPGKDGSNGANGKTSYFHIKYSSVANPTSSSQMAETPSTYIGTYVDYTEADSSDPSKYTWSRFQGLQGDKGIPGTDGTNGKTSYLHIAYANSADGKTGFDVSNSANKLYIGQYTDFNPTDSTDYTKYSWTKIKGEQGAKGNDGTSVKITAKSVTYQASTSGTTTPTGTWVANPPTVAKGQYLWTKTVVTYSDGNSTTAYSVAYQGTNGANGQNGTNGRGVKSTEVTYQIWTNGTSTPNGTWVTTVPDTTANKPYLWTRTVITYTDNTKSTSYSVGSTLKGVNVGGRNLYLGTKNFDGTKWKNKEAWSNAGVTDDGFTILSRNRPRQGMVQNIHANTGEVYTLTAFVKQEVNNASFIYHCGTLNDTSASAENLYIDTPFEPNVFKKFILKFRVTKSGIIRPGCEPINDKSAVYIYGYKLELGNIATDWTPAPEDVDEGINNAQSSADKANTNASNAQQTANNAQDTANKADAKADQAISDAASANTAAQIAKKQADVAQVKSDEANRIANGAAATISPIAQVVKVDSQGLKILNSEKETSYAQMQSTGLYVFVNKEQRSVFGVTSKTENLAVQDYLMFGAHRAEMKIEDGEEGTALFHVGDIK